MKLSFLNAFRFIFVLFTLYLIKEVFYFWDGFRYYASLYEFIPSVSLLLILWSILSLMAALIIWFPLRLYEWFALRFERKTSRYLLLFEKIFILLAVSVWVAKKFVWPEKAALEVKVIMFFCTFSASAFLTWLLMRGAGEWMDRIQEKIIPDIVRLIHDRITVLVWLFGICVILSIPIIEYHASFKQTNDVFPKKIRSPSGPVEQPNFVLVTFDTLTARDMSVYGYHRETTPFISKWAKDAALFTQAESASNFTTPSVASLMTGKRVWTHQVYHLGGAGHVKNKTENLPFILKKNGYFNAAFVVNNYASVRTLGISDSFNFAPYAIEYMEPGDVLFGDIMTAPGYFDTLLYKMFGEKILRFEWITDDRLLIWKKFRQTLARTAVPPEKAFNFFLANHKKLPQPFFVWIHLYPPHDPYLPPEPYKGMFTYQVEADRSDPNRHTAPARASYDEFIRYCDKQFEDFINSLQEKQLENTIIILSSDHGESFEHGVIGHRGPDQYEQLTHVPLVIRGPGRIVGKIINGLVELIDVPATILDLANIPIPSWMEGRSLVPLMHGGNNPPQPAFSMYFEKNRSRGARLTKGTIAVREGNYKLIHYLEENRSLLFNLLEDPGELDNLIHKEPDTGNHLYQLIRNNLNKANENILREW